MAAPERRAAETEFDEVLRRSVEGEESAQLTRAWTEADYSAFNAYCRELSVGDGSEPSEVQGSLQG